MNFFNYSGRMEIDLKSLEDKVSKLIGVCATLRDENQQLRSELTKVAQDSARLKSNMLQASDQLETLLGTLPAEGQS
jgi:cell division protein ZapB